MRQVKINNQLCEVQEIRETTTTPMGTTSTLIGNNIKVLETIKEDFKYIVKAKESVRLNNSNGFIFEIWKKYNNRIEFEGNGFIKSNASTISNKKCIDRYLNEIY